jgi:hypothetical protein
MAQVDLLGDDDGWSGNAASTQLVPQGSDLLELLQVASWPDDGVPRGVWRAIGAGTA